MDAKQESFHPDMLIKMEPDLGLQQTKENNLPSTKLQTFKKEHDHGELGVTEGHVNDDEMKPEFVVCEVPNIEQLSDSVQSVSTNIKQELDVANIKQEVPEYVQIKSEDELLNTCCDLPTLKSENIDYPDYLELPGTSKQGERKPLSDNAKQVSKYKKRRYPCPICQKHYPTSKSRLDHIDQHFRQRSVNSARSSRKKHNTHAGKYYETCYHCGQFFLNKSHFLFHLFIFHYVKKVTKLCKNKFKTNNYSSLKMELHTKSTYQSKANIPNKTLFQCEVCSKTLLSKEYLNTHLKIHSVDKPFTCKICSKRFLRKHTLTSHLKSHTGENSFKCEICLKPFSYISNLKIHFKVHTGEKPFECEICSKHFKEKSNLKKHLKIHTGEKLFQCKICSKRFCQKSNLKTHLKTHTGEKSFKCEICLKQFRLKHSLNSHSKSHTREKSFECEICSKKFTQRSSLKTHLRIHNGATCYSCEICSKQFTHKNSLYYHLKIHTGEKPFKCEICSKQFGQNSNLKTHLKIHTGDKPFKCKLCPRQFTRKCYLKSHSINCVNDRNL